MAEIRRGLPFASPGRTDYSVRLKPADAGLPPPIPAQPCRDRAIEVEWFLPENREPRKNGTAYWAKHHACY
jgi:hypothetical protein